jgi:hypothetical protein
MKKLIMIIWIFLCDKITHAQEIPPGTEEQLEKLSETDQSPGDDDLWLQDLEHLRKDPVNLNLAGYETMRQLPLLNELQIRQIIRYRELFGNLLSIFELQAVPGLDIQTIRKLLPFIKVEIPLSIHDEKQARLRDGDHSILIRVSQAPGGSGIVSPSQKYLGSPQHIFFRHKYVYKNLLQFGLTADKDAGEQFLDGKQSAGFDFYSFHFFARNIGIIHSLAVGDFTVNMGQGLIHWQGLAFKKSGDIMNVKRQSAILRPYSSAGEFYFHRGLGLTLRKGRLSGTAYFSLRKLSSNRIEDSISGKHYITSILNSGYHRTGSENDDRNNLKQTGFGINLDYSRQNWHLGLNAVYYKFSLPVQKPPDPYNQYAIHGDKWYNASADYSYTFKNLHFFGEAAIDLNLHSAFINGILVSTDSRVDLSLVHRKISSGYQAVSGNAFTENSYPTNECGLYAGISLRPFPGWKLEAYADIYYFPWLKYLTDAPAYGKDFLAQVTYTANKQLEISSRLRNESREKNLPENTTATNQVVPVPRQSWRTQISFKISPSTTIRERVELVWYDRIRNREEGFLSFVDILYQPMLRVYSAILRLQYFETGGYDSRIYAYENDVLYSSSIPASSGKGFRSYIILGYDLSRKISLWFRWSQTLLKKNGFTGAMPGRKTSEFKLQGRWILAKKIS